MVLFVITPKGTADDNMDWDSVIHLLTFFGALRIPEKNFTAPTIQYLFWN